MTATRQIGILGAGGQALETATYCNEAAMSVAFFAVEPGWESSAPTNGSAPVFPLGAVPSWAIGFPVIAAVGDPQVRRRLVERWPGTAFEGVVGTTAWIAADARLGPGCTIAPGACISAQAELGAHVLVNLGATISHDSEVGDFATVGPGCHIAGGTVIGADAVLGVGSAVLNQIRVGQGVVVGAGAVVTRDVRDGAMVKGVPAR